MQMTHGERACSGILQVTRTLRFSAATPSLRSAIVSVSCATVSSAGYADIDQSHSI